MDVKGTLSLTHREMRRRISLLTWSVISEDGSKGDPYGPVFTHLVVFTHYITNKRGVVKTLMHRVDTIVSDERDKVEEKSHMKLALTMNGYLEWLINSTPTI